MVRASASLGRPGLISFSRNEDVKNGIYSFFCLALRTKVSSAEKEPASSLVVSLRKAFGEIPLSLCDSQAAGSWSPSGMKG